MVVNGVPSQGKMVMVGNGRIGGQPVAAKTNLPAGKRDEMLETRNSSLLERDLDHLASQLGHDDVLRRSGLHARHHKSSTDRL